VHERAVSEEMGELLESLKDSEYTKETNSPDAVNIREIGRYYVKQKKLSKEFVEELTRVTSQAEHAWVAARKKKDFAQFLPHLEKVIKLKRDQADAYGYENDPYDCLIDDYEPGATYESIGKVFAAFRKELVPFLEAIMNSGKKSKFEIVGREYPIDSQKKFGMEVAKIIGFDFEAGRLDVTTHPFCSGIGPGDTRITTRYNPNRFPDAFFGTLHEAGHGIYDQGLNRDYFGLPMGGAVSLGIHESQSRMWENLVGRSRAFWEHFYGKAQKTFSGALGDVSQDDFFWAINDVRPSFIRVEADEVTYNLHIILRFELERELINNELSPADLPEAWNKRFEEYFGITPPDIALGCIQDVHWSAGLFGYFPTYALGNLYASQFFAKAKEDISDLYGQFRKGEFGDLKRWLNERIHSQGQRHPAEELVQVVTGKPLSHAALMSHMKEKFGELYGV
ncbi:MAG: carboxypeptidase M32, partial [candidate division Zixibacteria bacterium]|nr:carboxypeptidase M32 [candidate division Zixibacteria bacterium]